MGSYCVCLSCTGGRKEADRRVMSVLVVIAGWQNLFTTDMYASIT